MAVTLDSFALSQHVNQELKKLSTRWEGSTKGTRFWIKCPYHAGGQEQTPSFAIDLERRVTPNGTFEPGSAKCFGCGKFNANWNITADALGLEKIGKESLEKTHLLLDEANDQLLLDQFKKLRKTNANEKPNISEDTIPWDRNQDWRGIKGSLLQKVGARQIRNSYGKKMLYLPTFVHKKHIGGIRAKLVKINGSLSYLNTSGTWTKSKGLYPYDFTKAFIKKHKLHTIMLVEGPRDALASLQYGIPAVAILGTGNWDEIKADLILDMGIDRIIAALDPDKAGRKATRNIFKSLKHEVGWIKSFNFPDNIDPGNMPQSIANKILKYVE
jgi:hypothetical protein